MSNPNSGILDLGGGAPTLVPSSLAGWQQMARPARRVRNAVGEVATRFLAWRARQATLRLLWSLDAATLRDLGITDIESVVYGDPRDRMRGYDANWWREQP
ncbi:MAG: DUF1127 domain-containing protein [Alphaproteobacteria bacterium]